jgi:hypothetical protein
MSDEFNIAERVVEEVLIDLMTERVMSMSTCVQASSRRGLQASPLTTCGSGPSRPSVEKRTKNKDDLENAKLVPSIFPDYILPLAGAVNRDSVTRDFEYTMVTMYLPKGIRAVRIEQDKITHVEVQRLQPQRSKNIWYARPIKVPKKNKGKHSNIIP